MRPGHISLYKISTQRKAKKASFFLGIHFIGFVMLLTSECKRCDDKHASSCHTIFSPLGAARISASRAEMAAMILRVGRHFAHLPYLMRYCVLSICNNTRREDESIEIAGKTEPLRQILPLHHVHQITSCYGGIQEKGLSRRGSIYTLCICLGVSI